MSSAWHEKNGKEVGVDFRYIYRARERWWFCPTAVPSVEEFMAKVALLRGHVPSTGFAAVLDILACQPESVYITGFDFFASGIHNVNEAWRPGDPDDPIRHRPDLEAAWMRDNSIRFTCDETLRLAMESQ
jgi:hypothetical protein